MTSTHSRVTSTIEHTVWERDLLVIFSHSAAAPAAAFTLIFNFYYELAYRLSIVKKKQYGKNTVLYEKCPDDSDESYENVWHC